jgi:soluble lytic murein transglycosylase-like protein
LPDTAAAADPRVAGRARDAASEVAEALADERSHRYETTIRSAARLYQLPESLLRAVIHTESNYNPNAVSRTNAMGLTQLMPSTARFLGVTQPFEPRQNIYGGAKFLRLLANRFGGDMVLVLAGYFSGAGAVQKYGGVPPHSGVRGYVKAVLRRFYAYERELQLQGEESAGPSRSIAVP